MATSPDGSGTYKRVPRLRTQRTVAAELGVAQVAATAAATQPSQTMKICVFLILAFVGKSTQHFNRSLTFSSSIQTVLLNYFLVISLANKLLHSCRIKNGGLSQL